MADDLIFFRWSRLEHGYDWIEVPKGLVVNATSPTSGSSIWLLAPRDVWPRYHYVYSPSAIFRTFSELPTDGTNIGTRQAIAAFANQHGLLGGAAEVSFLAPAPDDAVLPIAYERSGSRRQGVITADSGHVWVKEIDRMRQAVLLWDLIDRGDDAELSKFFAWTPGGAVAYWHPDIVYGKRRPSSIGPTNWVITGETESDPPFGRGDVYRAALFQLRTFINDGMGNHTASRLLWHAGRQQMELRLVPDSLLSYMWLSFSRAVEMNKRFTQCEACGTWFELRRGIARSDKIYCSDACRSKAYRARQKRAAGNRST